MSAIEFVVRDSAGNLRRGVLAETETSTIIPMGAGEDVSLNLRLFQVTNYQRDGDNLVITTMDGRTITLESYFYGGQMDANDLFLSADGLLTPVELQQFGDSIEPVYQTAELFGKWSPNDALFYTDGAELDSVVVADEMVDDGVESTMLATGLLGGLGAAGGAAGVGGAALAGTALVGAGLGGGGDDDDDDDGDDDDDKTPPGGSGGTADTTPPTVSVEEGTVGNGDAFNRVNHSDGVEIAGKGEVGASITVETEGHNGQTVTQTTTVDANGDWDVVFPAADIPTGEYTRDITITATDAAGNTASVTDQILIDTETAVNITMVDGAAAGLGNVVNGASHADGTTLSGTGDANGTVTVTVQGLPPVNVPVDGNGSWSHTFTTTELPGGEYTRTVTVDITDPYGNTTSNTGAIVIDTVTNVSMVPGALGEGTVINEAERDSNGITVTGATQPNNQVAVTFTDNSGNQVTRNIQADNAGNWSATFAAVEIPDGEYDANVSVIATDAAGNTATTSQTLRIDTELEVDVNTATLEGNGIVNFNEAADGVTLTGTTDPNAQVRVDFNGVVKTVGADQFGNWSASYSANEVPSGERNVPVSVTATDSAGNIATNSGTVEIDTIVRNLSIADVTGDNVLNASDITNGFTLNGTTEPGAQWVEVTFGTMAPQLAQVDNNGNWALDFNNGIGNIPDGNVNVTVRTMDRNDNIDSVTEVVSIDTAVPGVPEIVFRMQGQDDTFGLGVTSDEGITSIQSVASDGTVTDLGITATNGSNGNVESFTFGTPVPDGTHLVVQSTDGAGNEAATLVLTEDGSANAVDLASTGLDGFDIASIDLSFAENSDLTITEQDLLDLSQFSNTLVVHGDTNNEVTAIGAQNTNQTETIDGKAYEIYSLGNDGTLIVDPDVNVNI